jgi:hypothetical protein
MTMISLIPEVVAGLMAALSNANTRLRTALGLFLITVAVATYVLEQSIRGVILPSFLMAEPLLGLLSALLFILGVSILLLAYLRGDYEGQSQSSQAEEGVTSALENLFRESAFQNRLSERIALWSKVGVTSETDAEHRSQVAETKNSRLDAIADVFEQTNRRLRQEIADLSRRGNLNLVIGTMITLGATSLLVYLVTRVHSDFQQLKDVLAFYIPRVTTVTLAEIFGYFFLSLYKANLEEIKYYQNELTTVAAQEVAWRASLLTDAPDSKAVVIQQIVKTDRNPVSGSILKNGSYPGTDVSGLVEILQNVSKLIVKSTQAKE